jgi:diguanylate cyclase (GGDEF)-like protein/PAS domain S-box-containing protein
VDEGISTARRAIEAEFEALIANEPRAFVAAVNADGFFVPLPVSFTIERHRVLQARTALDFVVPDDRVAVIDTWHEALDTGAGRMQVRLANVPDETTPLYLFDLTHRHGTYFCVLILPEGAQDLRLEEGGAMASRVTWTSKSERAFFLDVDPGLERILGWTRDDLVGNASLDFIVPEDQELAIDNWLTMLASGGDGQRVRLRHLHKDGHHVWVEITNKNLLDDPDNPHVIAQMIDISEEMAAHEALREREQLLNRLAEALPSGLLHVFADGTVVYTNERLHEIVAAPRSERIESQLKTILRDDWPAFEAALASVLAGEDADLELRLQLPGERDLRLCDFNMRSLSESDGTINGAIISIADVTESARLRDELHQRATRDALTGCYNRATVMQALQDCIDTPDESLAVVFLDLDRFKAINDELGHAAGDELLVVAAERLRSAVRPGDVIGRLGGDEFLVVCREVVSREEAVAIADHVAASMAREVELDAGVIELRSSVGVAWSGGDLTSADEFVARADAAMYESKRRGIGKAVAFSQLLQRSDHNLDQEHALHQALEHGDLHLRFQPIVRIETGDPVGYEGLVHWSRADGGVTASEFIEMAEDTGLIHALGVGARDELMRTAAKHLAHVGDANRWFCNVSARELQMPGAVDMIVEAIDRSGLAHGSVVVEFRCDVGLDQLERMSRALGELHRAGVELAIDDFGEGWAPIEVLRVASPSWLKLAPAITRSITSDPVAMSIARATLDLASSLDATVVAKGIESLDQREALTAIGIEVGQGHLFAAAAPIETFLVAS